MVKKSIPINISSNDLVYPYFVVNGKNRKQEIKHFPGILRFSCDQLIRDIAGAYKLGLKSILLFGIPESKDLLGSAAYSENNPVAQAIKSIKKEFPGITVISDVCLCAYTTHGHCGILEDDGKRIDRGRTLETLSRTALSYAAAGSDWVAPSAMAKMQVLAIRKRLNENLFAKTKIMGYSAKFASNFYGPFRDAAGSSPKFGDRSGYQLDYNDAREALIKIKDDIKEGADMVMVKPALSYLDIINQAKRKFDFPLVAYNVSGEYSMVKYGIKAGLWEERRIVPEIIGSIKRAGADVVISYHAKDIVRWLKE